MDQKDLLEKIKYDAKDLPIPDSLQPDSIEKLLQENSRSRSTDTTDFERAAKRRQLRRRWLRFGSCIRADRRAAVAVLADRKVPENRRSTGNADDSRNKRSQTA